MNSVRPSLIIFTYFVLLTKIIYAQESCNNPWYSDDIFK